MLVLVLTFELEWPSQVTTLMTILQPIADVSQRILSLDCLINPKSGEGLAGLKMSYFYLLLYLALPVALMMLVILFWRIRAGQREWRWVSSRVITSVIVLFFLVHPPVTR